MTPEKYKRVLLVNVKGSESGFGKLISGGKAKPVEILKELLEAKGFEVEIYESTEENFNSRRRKRSIMNAYAAKRPIKELTDKYDLIINVANVSGSCSTYGLECT